MTSFLRSDNVQDFSQQKEAGVGSVAVRRFKFSESLRKV